MRWRPCCVPNQDAPEDQTLGAAQPRQQVLAAAEHQGLKQQALIGADQQTGELQRWLLCTQLAVLLGGGDQLGKSVLEAG